MTQEELKEFLKDENNTVIFGELAKELGYESQDEVKGLKNKKNELLSSWREEKDKRLELEKRLDNIDIDAYNEYVNGNKNKDNSELNKIKRELKEANDRVQKLSKIENDYNNALKLNAVKDALFENNVDSKHTKILTSAFLGKAKVEVDGDCRNVIINDDDGLGLPPKEFFKNWIETETGKAYLAKPENKGSNSSSFSSGGSKMSRSEFDKKPALEKKSLIEKGIQITDL